VLTAVDSSDNSSKHSAPKLLYVSGSENLAIPQLLTADYDSSSRVIKIHWRMVGKDTAVRRYLLKKENDGNFMPILLREERDEYLLREVEPNSGEYRFKIRLLAANGTLVESNELNITVR